MSKYQLKVKMINGDELSSEVDVPAAEAPQFDQLINQVVANFERKEGVFSMTVSPDERVIFSFKDVVYFKVKTLQA